MSAFSKARIDQLRALRKDDTLILELLDEVEGLSKPKPLLKRGANEEWGSPAKIFDPLNEEFGFTLDVCATTKNKKHYRYYAKENDGECLAIDGLTQDWAKDSFGGACWMNPPYNSKALYSWTRKAYLESQRGATIACLVPAKMDQPWWHEYAVKGEIRPIKGRVKFEGAKHTALFSCAILVFRGNQ